MSYLLSEPLPVRTKNAKIGTTKCYGPVTLWVKMLKKKLHEEVEGCKH